MRKIPAPAVNAENKAFFDAATNGKLLLKFCNDCKRSHHYPRALCPHCFSDKTEWREGKGTGTVYTWSVLRAVPDPYCIAYVTLEEGVTILTNLVDCDLEKVTIGMKVKAVFKPAEGGAVVPMFTAA